MSQLPALPEGAAARESGALEVEGMPMRFGKYTLLRRLATGGMAELFLAIQRSVAGFEKLIVIKRILPAMNQDRAFIDMLLDEARIAATLSHPNIVQIFDVGQESNQYYIAMEHVHGEDLRSIVRQMKKVGVAEFPLEHALQIIIGTCSGLAYAHEKRGFDGTPLSIVHRDVSPQNVVVTFAGDVKIVDFGIAKSDVQWHEQTKSGKLKGKVPYMSPEQARGEPLDARSDIFATGTMLFELTTGKRLFKGQSEYETLKLICDREYPLPSEVIPDYPPELEAIVMRALAKNRDERYPSARAMQADLEAFVRSNQIAVSSLELHRFMESLFEDKLAEQKEALLQGKHLADIIESQPPVSGVYPDASASLALPPLPSLPPFNVPSTTRTITEVRPARRRRWALALGGVALGVVLAGSGFLVAKHDSATPAALARGSLSLTSQPSGASIWINGDLRPEITPAKIDHLPTGVALDVKVTMDGFEHAKRSITLDGAGSVSFELKKGSVVADVKLAPVDVANATFAIDGKPVTGPRIDGIASAVIHTLTVSAPGYRDASTAFTGAPFETKRIDVKLEKLDKTEKAPEKAPLPPAHVAVWTPPQKLSAAPAPVGNGKLNVGASGGWCNVTVDGAPRGATPVAGLELPAGVHKLTCTSADGSKTMDGSVTITAGETARYKFTL